MWEMTHFGETYDCNGSIGNAIASIPSVANAVGNQVPYVNGVQAGLDTVPPTGAKVSFRPRMSGKA